MLKIDEIKELIELINNSTIDELSYEQDGSKVKIKKNTNQVNGVEPPVQYIQPAQTSAVSQQSVIEEKVNTTDTTSTQKAVDESLHTITSPMVGTFYQSASPDQPPYVTVGASVQKDSVVCIVEAMKLFNEIEAEVEGEIVEMLVNDGQLVEYGQPLFVVKPR